MKTFFAVVSKDEGSAFGVHFPDVPDCFSAADDLDDVVRNASQALSFYFEDADPVEPRGFEAIRDAAAEDIAQGAFLMAVPLIVNSGKQVRANISLDRGMLDAIDRAAKERGLTRSSFITEAARNEIEAGH